MRVRTRCGLATLALALSISGTPGVASQSPRTMLAVEGHTNQFPFVAARGTFVVVAWGATNGGASDVYTAVSRDGGRTFGAPVRVNAEPGTARLAGEIPPRVALASRGANTDSANTDPSVVVAWNAKASETSIRISRSQDGGRTFAGETTLQAAGAPGDRGWHSLALDDNGTPHVLWLDHRGHANRPPAAAHEHMDGPAMAQRSGLYYARGGNPSLPEKALTHGVCYCCKSARAAGPGGQLYAAWRHVYAGNIRDIAFVASMDRGQTFAPVARVSEDNWHLPGCPDDGPALDVDGSGRVHVVWPTVIDGDEPEGALFHATSTDGRTFTPRQRVETFGSRKPEHPHVLVAEDGRVLVAWDEVMGGVRRAGVRALRIDASGRLTAGAAVRLGADAPGAYPVLASTSRGPIAAWTHGTRESTVIAVEPINP